MVEVVVMRVAIPIMPLPVAMVKLVVVFVCSHYKHSRQKVVEMSSSSGGKDLVSPMCY